MARRARQRWLRVHSVFCTVCMFDPANPFFPKWHASYFPWNLSFFLLAQVCYTADCNVLMLWQSSCSSTFPLFVQQTKDGPYLNVHLASKHYLFHTKQPAEIKAPWTYIDRSLNTSRKYLSLLTGRSKCLKVHHAFSSLPIHTRFDDIMRSRGWNKFRGLHVDCHVSYLNYIPWQTQGH